MFSNVGTVHTPKMLLQTAAFWLVGQLLVIVVVASAVPGGASALVLLGFVTPAYDHNVFSARAAAVPWTDPTVWFSVQSLLQVAMVAAAASAVITLFRTNSWQHGVLPDSAPPKPRRPEGETGPPAGAPAAGPTSPPAAPPGPASPPPSAPGPASASGGTPAHGPRGV